MVYDDILHREGVHGWAYLISLDYKVLLKHRLFSIQAVTIDSILTSEPCSKTRATIEKSIIHHSPGSLPTTSPVETSQRPKATPHVRF
jgi:hypothetical protein